MKKGKLFILSGPSGVGKDTLIYKVLPRIKKIKKITTATSRPPRKGEKNGIHYHFYSPYQFKENIKNNFFIEYVIAHGKKNKPDYYGTPLFEFEPLKNGIHLIINMEVKGAETLKKKFPRATRIFILPDNLEQLKKQLTQRGKENQARIKTRLQRARYEIGKAKLYDHIIINHYKRPEKASDELYKLLKRLTGE